MEGETMPATAKKLEYLAIVLGVMLAAFSLGGCSGNPTPSNSDSTSNSNSTHVSTGGGTATTDEMFSDYQENATFNVFIYGDEVISISDEEPVRLPWDTPLEDAHFYEVVADVTYLNGGVAGYYNYPQIERVHSVEEVDPANIDIPKLDSERYYGITKIGNYAKDGDYLLYESVRRAVWKDGEWIYKYDTTQTLDDGTKVLAAKGISNEDIEEGISSGVKCCKDYFVLPNKG